MGYEWDKMWYITGIMMGQYRWDVGIDMEVSSSSWEYPKIGGLFHGKSHLEMDDPGVPLFQETTIQSIIIRLVSGQMRRKQ